MDQKTIQQVIALSGLPTDGADAFLQVAFEERGLELESANLEDLRLVLADLLQDFILNSEEITFEVV